jgi:hypothetical protein
MFLSFIRICLIKPIISCTPVNFWDKSAESLCQTVFLLNDADGRNC